MIQSADMFALRQYQENLLRQVQHGLATEPRARLMLQLPTGGGKTVIAGALLGDWLQGGRKAVWLTHRKELAEQTWRMLTDAGVSAITNVNWTPGEDAPAMAGGAVILMAQTVGRRNARREVWNRYDANDLLVIDEAHHAAAPGWERAMQQWPGPIVGMTATPWRLSEKEGFDHLFDVLIGGPQTADLQALDTPALCPAQVFIPTPEQRIAGGAVDRTGDYTEAGIEQANRDRPDILTAGALAFWQKHAAEPPNNQRPTIAYAVSVDHAHNLAAVFNEADVPAAVILGDTNREDRDKAIAGFRDGSVKVLVNVIVATEGFDLPDASCIIIARPTMSLALYLQIVGRGLRPKPDGGDCQILDLAANAVTHGLPEDYRAWSLEPRGTQKAGEAPIVVCPECGVASPASSHHCQGCGHAFGKVCDRCGRWRSYRRRWRYEKHCDDAHQLVCDLCHIDAHILAHLPIVPPLDELVGLYSPEDEMTFPSDVETDDDLANRLSALFRELLQAERQSIAGADDARREELRQLIEWRDLVLGDEEELVRQFDEHIATLPQRPNRIRELQMFGDWRTNLESELAGWQNELTELESRPIDKQAIFGSVRTKIVHVLQREASANDLLPDHFGTDYWQPAPVISPLSGPSSFEQARIGSRDTVKESAIYWLAHVVTKHNGQTVGLTYDEVLENILSEHPSAQTTRKSIAFYASHIKRRERGYEHGTLPDIRPRTSGLQRRYADIPKLSQFDDALLVSDGIADAEDNDKWTPLHDAAREGNTKVVQALLASGANPNTAGGARKSTPLHCAAEEGHAEAVQTLLAGGADPNAEDDYKRTPLHRAAGVGDAEAVQMLLAGGADPNAEDDYKETPLHRAAGVGDAEAVQALLVGGADPKAENNYKRTPLHYAAGEGHAEAVQMLLAGGADPKAENNYKGTPLHLAAWVGDAEAVQVLLAGGADPKAEDNYKKTPLHLAAWVGDAEAVQALLVGGADPDVEDEDKQTPLDIAEAEGHTEVVQALQLRMSLR